MDSLVHNVQHAYRYLVYDLADKRTKDWFFVGSPWPVLVILVVYHNFVYKIGPALMKNRKPFNVDRIIQVYNVIQVVLCVWFVLDCFINFYGPTGAYGVKCQAIDYSTSPIAMRAAALGWGYYMMKILDLLDTVFFVVRKKMSQVTFLHVYHHIGMVILTWFGMKYLPGGQGLFLVFINSFVHALMYGYYFLSNYNPEHKRQIWWKKYLTQLQILQFMLIFLQFGRIPFDPECTYPRWPIYIFLPHNLAMVILFGRFYKKAYLSNKPKSA